MVNKKIRKEKKKRRQNQRLRERKEFEVTTHFPFLQNDSVADYIQRSKVMFIMRGLPGSGKSTLVKLFQEKYENSVVCSADDYFLKSGSYNFEADCLKEAHSFCQDLAEQSCTKEVPVVVIDNTNVMRWEMKHYLELAVANDYVVILVVPKTWWRLDSEELARRNTHGVTAEILRKKVKMFQDAVPLYYGWFLNKTDSESLLEMGRKYHHLCLQHSPALRQALLKLTDPEENPERSLKRYFTRDGSAGILHMTSRFCRWGKVEGSRKYHGQAHVKEACGRVFKLCIVGITITPRTLAARVKLDKRQLRLWDNDHLAGSSSANTGAQPENGTEMRTSENCEARAGPWKSSKENKKRGTDTCIPKGTVSNVATKNPFSVLSENGMDGAVCRENDSESKGAPVENKGSNCDNTVSDLQRGLSAHVTLGYARGIKPQQSGPDILDIVAAAEMVKPSLVVQLDDAVMNYYGEGRCEVVFTTKVKFDCIFSGFY